MFTFNFSHNNSTKENEENQDMKKDAQQLSWFQARKIDIPSHYFKTNCQDIDYRINLEFPDFPFKLVDSQKVVVKLSEENCENIIEAESQHSDLLPAKYEGGLKVWECTYDLGNYLFKENIPLSGKTVLDLGCGAGIIGIIALLRGAMVHFQDYNPEVIESFTIPNVMLNCDIELLKEKCDFYSGDWESFVNTSTEDKENKTYDFIFTSETIYNSDNHHKLYQVFKQKLGKSGVGFVAAKTYYFGVGGGMRQFEELIKKDNEFNVQVVWKSTEGLQREILKLERNTFQQ